MSTIETNLGPIYVDDEGKPDQPVALLWPSLFTDHRMWHHQISTLHGIGFANTSWNHPATLRAAGPAAPSRWTSAHKQRMRSFHTTGDNAPAAHPKRHILGQVASHQGSPPAHAGTVRAMVLFNTSAERGTPFERMRAATLTKLMAIGALDKTTVRMSSVELLAPETRRQQPRIGADLAEQMLTWDRRRFITSVRSVLIDRDSVLDKLAEVKVPTLVVSGTEDHTLPATHSQRIADHLPGARHVEISGATHLAALEKPDEANSLILDFLKPRNCRRFPPSIQNFPGPHKEPGSSHRPASRPPDGRRDVLGLDRTVRPRVKHRARIPGDDTHRAPALWSRILLGHLCATDLAILAGFGVMAGVPARWLLRRA